MVWLVKDQKCPVCGKTHHLYTDDMPAQGARYTFTCPTENAGGLMQFTAYGLQAQDVDPQWVKADPAK